MPIHCPGLATMVVRDLLAAEATTHGFSRGVVVRIQGMTDEQIDRARPTIEKYLERWSEEEEVA